MGTAGKDSGCDSMRVGLIDVDGHNFPNIPLMRKKNRKMNMQDMRKRAKRKETVAAVSRLAVCVRRLNH